MKLILFADENYVNLCHIINDKIIPCHSRTANQEGIKFACISQAQDPL